MNGKVTRAPDGRPFAFQDLPSEAYPVTIRGRLDGPEGEVLWERILEPYVATEIPGCAPEHEGRMWAEVIFGNGEVVFQPPLTRGQAEAYIERRIQESEDD